MSAPSEHEQFRHQLIDLLAIKIGVEIKTVSLPDEGALKTYRELAQPKADEIIRNYEKGFLIHEIREIVVTDLRKELSAKTRATKILEIVLVVSPIIVGALIGLSQFIFEAAKHQAEISAIYYSSLILSILQFAISLYLKLKH